MSDRPAPPSPNHRHPFAQGALRAAALVTAPSPPPAKRPRRLPGDGGLDLLAAATPLPPYPISFSSFASSPSLSSSSSSSSASLSTSASTTAAAAAANEIPEPVDLYVKVVCPGTDTGFRFCCRHPPAVGHSKCTFSCAQVPSMREHLREHGGDKPYVCPVQGCPFRCARKSNLKNHLQRHKRIKPYACATCSYRACSKVEVQRHMFSHMGPEHKRHVCPFAGCDYRGFRKSTLDKHMLRHTGAKPYTCPVCNRQFTQKSNAQRHQRKKHPESALTIRKSISAGPPSDSTAVPEVVSMAPESNTGPASLLLACLEVEGPQSAEAAKAQVAAAQAALAAAAT